MPWGCKSLSLGTISRLAAVARPAIGGCWFQHDRAGAKNDVRLLQEGGSVWWVPPTRTQELNESINTIESLTQDAGEEPSRNHAETTSSGNP